MSHTTGWDIIPFISFCRIIFMFVSLHFFEMCCIMRAPAFFQHQFFDAYSSKERFHPVLVWEHGAILGFPSLPLSSSNFPPFLGHNLVFWFFVCYNHRKQRIIVRYCLNIYTIFVVCLLKPFFPTKPSGSILMTQATTHLDDILLI